jgi:hypothetical protein
MTTMNLNPKDSCHDLIGHTDFLYPETGKILIVEQQDAGTTSTKNVEFPAWQK